jgi:hypothetical protein
MERPAFQKTGRAIVLMPGGDVGIISITDVKQVLRALDLASAAE